MTETWWWHATTETLCAREESRLRHAHCRALRVTPRVMLGDVEEELGDKG